MPLCTVFLCIVLGKKSGSVMALHGTHFVRHTSHTHVTHTTHMAHTSVLTAVWTLQVIVTAAIALSFSTQSTSDGAHHVPQSGTLLVCLCVCERFQWNLIDSCNYTYCGESSESSITTACMGF